MTVMFDKLLGKKNMSKYKILEDQMHTGDERLISYSFASELIRECNAQFFLYLTKRISEGMYKSRFIVFSNSAQRVRFITDNLGKGSEYIDELALTYLN